MFLISSFVTNWFCFLIILINAFRIWEEGRHKLHDYGLITLPDVSFWTCSEGISLTNVIFRMVAGSLVFVSLGYSTVIGLNFLFFFSPRGKLKQKYIQLISLPFKSTVIILGNVNLMYSSEL